MAQTQAIQAQRADLFPETLLVSRAGDRLYTTSDKVARQFGKPHKNVLRRIRMLLDDLAVVGSVVSRPHPGIGAGFVECSALDEQGKTQPLYQLSQDAFALLTMSFRGPEALAWKIQFLAAFRDMERQIQAQRTREARALYRLRPRWEHIIRNPGLHPTKLIELTGHKSTSSIAACRKRMLAVGLLDLEPQQ